MRIITGSAKGMVLYTLPGLAVRPTSDRVKESLFNILRDRVTESKILDLFAGTGNLGIEALSRGAAVAVFVDNHPRSIQCIRRNLVRTRLASRGVIYQRDAFRVLDYLAGAGWQFDVIFCDPPYNKGLATRALQMIGEKGLLAPEGLLVVEHSRHETLLEATGTIVKVRTAQYGETMLSIYCTQNEEE